MSAWYVDSLATGTGAGTSWANAYTTFAAIVQASLAADDIVYVMSGTYNVRHTITKSGTSGHRITYVGYGPTKPKLYGVTASSITDIAWLNMEMRQVTTAQAYAAIAWSSCSRWLVEDCYVHDTYFNGLSSTGTNNDNEVRANLWADIGSIDNGKGGGSNPDVMDFTGDRNLAEYNIVLHSMDRCRAFGTGNVARNNAWRATDTNLYVGGGPGDRPDQYPSHTDGFQSFQAGPCNQLLYEANFDIDNVDSIEGNNAHAFLVQDDPGGNNFNRHIFRRNIVIRPGGGGPDWQNVKHVYVTNNTFIRLNNGLNPGSTYGGVAAFTYPSTFTAASSDRVDFRNNILAYAPKTLGNNETSTSGPCEFIPTNFTSGTNLFYNDTGSQARYPAGSPSPANLSQVDPGFVDGTGVQGHDDYRLLVGSTARAAGSAKATATAAGTSSTTLIVTNAEFFVDGLTASGWASIDADWIKIGTGGTLVQIASINYATNTITLTAARTWLINDQVFLKGSDDVGALHYTFSAALTNSLVNTSLTVGANTLTSIVNNTDAVRKVAYYVDGVCVGTSYTSATNYPISYTADGATHTVTSRAFYHHASNTPTVDSVRVLSTSSPISVVPVNRIKSTACIGTPF